VTALHSVGLAPGIGLRPRWENAVLLGESSAVLGDWITWLTLSRTPPVSSRLDPVIAHPVRDGLLVEQDLWPRDPAPQVYVAFDDERAVYVGQTRQALKARVKQHFGNQSTTHQQAKAGSWRLVVSATWDDLLHGQLDQLEAAAWEWVLPKALRTGRRRPQ
jgi:predicted GIY-YIG superfamily endonuclease